ncbi:hypothetical protein ACFFSW_06205 [Saccharothrix longispora]|uniref:Uncharacterized protein n=1 Tax=Saccharothrix longispora TaxID=33920 RepID=A0ABU1PTD2_9PSEU|nr:hypothetical protein [Saccharothrix longispora]MDR6593911.1 hypothetical protein [Saccharothrix longispora]
MDTTSIVTLTRALLVEHYVSPTSPPGWTRCRPTAWPRARTTPPPRPRSWAGW